MANNTKNNEKSNRKPLTIVALIIVLILLVTIGITACKHIEANNGTADAPTKVQEQSITDKARLGVDPNAGEYVAPETTTQAASGGIAIPGWGHINLPAGQKNVSVNFKNPEANMDKYYLTFKLELKSTGEVLYTSGLVPPGQTIQNITLSKPLDEGTYDAVVHVQPYTMDAEQNATNNADMETQLIVA